MGQILDEVTLRMTNVAGELPIEKSWDAIRAGEVAEEEPVPWLLWGTGITIVGLGIIGLVKMRKDKEG